MADKDAQKLAAVLASMQPTPRPDPTDFTNMLNTPIPPEQIAEYNKWLNSLPPQMDQTGRNYDLQGAYLAGLSTAGNGHLPDTFKKPNHPTFSTESKYSGGDFGAGGTWTQNPNKTWAFTVSPDQLKISSPDSIVNYFKNNEPTGKLTMPNNTKLYGN